MNSCSLFARALAQTAVERCGKDAGLVELFGDMFGRILRGHEHQHAAPFVLLHQVAQQLRAAAGVYRNGALHDARFVRRGVGHGHAHGVFQQRLGQRLHVCRKGGRKEQVLAPRWQQRQGALQFLGKPQVQQPVGFVQHQQVHAGKLQRVVVHQIEQAARRGDHHIGTTAQAHHLRVDGDAAKHHGHFHGLGQVLGQAAHHLTHLGGELACGHQNQRAHPPRCVGRTGLQLLQQGQGKSCRFARTRLG